MKGQCGAIEIHQKKKFPLLDPKNPILVCGVCHTQTRQRNMLHCDFENCGWNCIAHSNTCEGCNGTVCDTHFTYDGRDDEDDECGVCEHPFCHICSQDTEDCKNDHKCHQFCLMMSDCQRCENEGYSLFS